MSGAERQRAYLNRVRKGAIVFSAVVPGNLVSILVEEARAWGVYHVRPGFEEDQREAIAKLFAAALPAIARELPRLRQDEVPQSYACDASRREDEK